MGGTGAVFDALKNLSRVLPYLYAAVAIVVLWQLALILTGADHIWADLRGSARMKSIGAKNIMPIKAGHYIGNGFYGRTDFIDRSTATRIAVCSSTVIANNLAGNPSGLHRP